MSKNRQGESDAYPFRANRIFAVGNEWFISTREGTELGPFASRLDAEGELTAYLRELAVREGGIRED
ncbi:MAG: DUF6316 family protein [Gammaproteobacteria bacterium]|nr:DUF6316 family protein [Gammaproteobacteria bacterium]